jgi:exodeoxyribonuclease X
VTFIRVLDLETSHETPEKGGVVEIGYCDLHVTGLDLLGAPIRFDVGDPHSILTHPGCPIPPVTAAIHHIIDDDVSKSPPWGEMMPSIVDSRHVNGSMIAIAAHSVKFEKLWCESLVTVPFLCTYKLALRCWPEAPSHSNQGLRYWRKPAGLVRETAMPAHRAGPDAYVTAHLLRDLLEEAAQRNPGDLIGRAAKISEQPALQVICRIGDWRDKKWSEVDDGFLDWILRKDFDEDVVFTVRHEIERRRQAAEKQAEEDHGSA